MRVMSKFMLFALAAFWIVAGVIGLLPALFSVMFIGAPGALARPATVAFTVAVFTFPGACFLSAIVALGHRATRPPSAYLILLLPLINLAVGAAAFTWIQQFQGGRFNG
jgi:hypothetical protein